MPPTRNRQPRFYPSNRHRIQQRDKPLVEEAHTTIGGEEKYGSEMPYEYVLEDKKHNDCDDGGTPITSNGDAGMHGVAAAEPQQDIPGGTLEFRDDSTAHNSTGGLKHVNE